ncbi:unnamed protein product [Lactuca saligna]|uniref:DUF4283 domain-containing protein n=1 Tax=Lactuca saligna TaxID=75948 RepID=A0AA36DYF0_LACSI|nr:unnamed protein product [Lactuca saligna]
MGQKLGKNKQYYAFIRYRGVGNAKELEKRLVGVKVGEKILAVNIALHERKVPVRNQTPNEQYRRSNVEHTAMTRNYGTKTGANLRDHRSYADILKPVNAAQTHPPSPPPPVPVILHPEQATSSWLRKISLVGEAASLEHLGNLPKLLLDKGETCAEVKYIGGLRVLMMFDYSIAAKEFMFDELKWKEYLKWVRWENQVNSHEERVAWIRVTGLPLHLWGQRNFRSITDRFGKTIAPFEDIPHRVDLSHAKIGLLTHRRTRINDEIQAMFEGKVYKLGIIEFDEDWFPFKFDPPEDGNKKTVGDVEMPEHNDEREEGEIWPENNEIDDQDLGESRVPTSEPNRSEKEAEASVQAKVSREEAEWTPRNMEFQMANGQMEQPSHGNDAYQLEPSSSKSNTIHDGPGNGLPPLGCFGPFPSPTICNEAHTFILGRSNGKRRRVLNKTPSISLVTETGGDIDPMPHTVPLPESLPNSPIENQIDLNTPPIQQAEFIDEYPQNLRRSEAIKTAEIGKELGFDINPDDPILREAMGDEGEHREL